MPRERNLKLSPLRRRVLEQHILPTLDEEKGLQAQGYHLVAGVDEVGRGSLAGPVVASAVILPPTPEGSWLSLVRDSKELSPRKREALVEPITEAAIAVEIGVVPPEVIDARGIVRATQIAMTIAIYKLHHPPQFILTDAVTLPELRIPQKAIIHGDKLSLSIACASIIAKVSRDKMMMMRLDEAYPGYGFIRNKGYATREHLLNLQRLGPCLIHRRSFAPVKDMVK